MQINEVNEEIFWDVVEKIDYVNNYYKYKHNLDALHVWLLCRYTPNAIEQFYDMTRSFSLALYDRAKTKDIHGTDTGHDAMALAVGLGKNTYYKLLGSQDAFDQFIDKYYDDFYESFIYCFSIVSSEKP